MTGGYIQTNILGSQRALKFGSLAAENIMSELMTLGIATGGTYSAAMISVIIYWGMYNNAFNKRVVLDVSFEEICDWVDEHFADPTSPEAQAMIDIVKCYEESKHSKLVLETLENTVAEVKKKMEKKKSSTSRPPKDGNISEGSHSVSSDSISVSTTT